ncbi:hypothetical protein TYRP_004108 [Tyrophagus putrescentiae]|nr:hypothetical protein TYRP_004108 [Tyrophagus putrescentiae]
MGNEETTSDFGIRVEDSIIYNSTSSFVDKHLEDEYLKGMMKIINKYKFGQGIAASVVNSFANDFLLLHQSIQPNNSSFKDYQKIALSEHLQEVYIEKTNPCYIEPLSLDKIQDIDGQMYDFKYSMTPLKSIISRALQNQSLVDHLYKEQHQNSSSFLSTVSLPNPLITIELKENLS